MEFVLEILKITIPAVIAIVAAYLTLRLCLEKELKKQLLEIKAEGKKVLNPIRLQAYERIALFLERTRPESILLRTPSGSLNANQYRTILLSNIRSEFEHNLSQQVYISGALWQATKKAKEETTKIINLAAGKIAADASGTDLAAKILEIHVAIVPQPADTALELLRKEITELY